MSTTASQSAPVATTPREAPAWPNAPHLQTLVQVPTPGDHYSPATGSALVTIIYELARAHAARGGDTRVIVSRGTRHDHDTGKCTEVRATAPPRRGAKAVDMALGRLGLDRPIGTRVYRPHAEAIPRDFAGPVLVHNNPVALPMFRRRLPEALVCLWANNELWHTYTDREADRIAEAADRLICCSEYIARGTRARLDRRHHEKVRVVRNGVDAQRFRPADTQPAGEPVVLFVGRVVPEKGAHLLLEAAAKLGDAVGGFRVRIVGSAGFTAEGGLSPYEKHLRELAAPLGDRAEFVPFRDRAAVLGEYARASVFCVPSDWDDPCPLTVMEGLACGLPLVVSRRGGIPEEVGDAALVFDPASVDELAQHLRTLLRDADTRRAYGRKARARALAATWDHQHAALMRALSPSEDGAA